jgi:hypothetical protein
LDEVLTVVEDQEELSRGEEIDHRLEVGAPATHGGLEGSGDLDDDLIGIGQRRQLHQPRPIGVGADEMAGDLDRQRGLAHPAHAGERHQPMFINQALDLGRLLPATDEHRCARRQVVRPHGLSPG